MHKGRPKVLLYTPKPYIEQGGDALSAISRQTTQSKLAQSPPLFERRLPLLFGVWFCQSLPCHSSSQR